jgi:hypothetical protein
MFATTQSGAGHNMLYSQQQTAATNEKASAQVLLHLRAQHRLLLRQSIAATDALLYTMSACRTYMAAPAAKHSA